jgi:hypothetical protein
VSDIDVILQEYAALRDAGIGAKEALRRMRPHIEPLPRNVKDQLVGAIRSYEAGINEAPDPTPQTTQQVARIKPIKPIETASKPKVERVYCWNCGKPNRIGEVICVHCGVVLSNAQSEGSTKKLKKDDFQPEYYNENSVLNLYVRHTDTNIQMRPQERSHEMIVGRADSRGIVTPDVDLGDHGAAQMGVSRMHMSIGYDSRNERLIITDMGSVNGLYVNGQRLASKEERVLRHGDQLRLGDMLVDVTYNH